MAIKKFLILFLFFFGTLGSLYAQITISGNTDKGNVTLKWKDGTEKTTISDASGNYSISVSTFWSGTVTPSKTGYSFNPANRNYTNLTSDQTNQNYTATLDSNAISGNTGVASAILAWSDGTNKTTTSDASGNYSLNVSYGWSGTVTPSKTGYSFNPPNKNYTNVTTDQTNQNYTATLDSNAISGNTGVAGATLSWNDGTNKTTISDAGGNYSLNVSYGWSGTVTPSKTGYSFNPPNKTYLNVISNKTNQNYTALINSYKISGNTDEGNVTLTWIDNTEKSILSETSGNYLITVPYGWSGTVTPSKTGFTFNPVNRSYTNIISDTAKQNYMAIRNTYTVKTDVNPSEGGKITGLNQDGKYLYEETVSITAEANNGYSFENWTSGGKIVSTKKTISFIATKDTNLTANFNHDIYTIIAISQPPEAGTTSGSGAAFYGESFKIIAKANPQWKFVNWTSHGNEVSKDTAYTFTVTGDSSFVANFKKADLIVNCYVEPSDGGFTSGCGVANYNEEITVVAKASPNWKFKNWTENGTVVSSDSQYTFTVLKNTELIAHFDFISGVEKNTDQVIPHKYFVTNAYPNPFNPSTSFQFGLPEESYVKLLIFDITGQVVKIILNGTVLPAGVYTNHFKADNLASGIYLYLLSANSTFSNKSIKKSGKLMLLK